MADRHQGREHHRQHLGPAQSTTPDRTSALVASGLVLMAVVGVATVFSETIAAAWSPASTAATEPALAGRSGSEPSKGSDPPAGSPADARGGTSPP